MTKALIGAAGVFGFIVPEYLDDDVVVGKVCGVNIHAGEVRRLNEALREERDLLQGLVDGVFSGDNRILALLRTRDLIPAIKLRRELTREGLKEAKDYVDKLGAAHGLRELQSRYGYVSYGWVGLVDHEIDADGFAKP